MYYVQGTIAKINQDVICYYDTEVKAIKGAKRMAKDADYCHVWYGNTGLRVQIK